MDKPTLEELFLNNPVIASVKCEEDLQKCLQSNVEFVFILYGNLIEIVSTIEKIKEVGKLAMVPVDLVDGLSSHDAAIDYIIKNTRADGVISTKASLLRYAKAQGLLTVQRFFLLDSRALENIERQLTNQFTDMIEIIPGLMPKIVRKIVAISEKPVIVGGLISDKEDIVELLRAGAMGITTSNAELWFI
ncbi:MAG: glycerol-3-phosphate responsive antiterminator [Clostridia bacterium]